MPPPTVFISYAHESDALRAAVKALADWLGRNGCTVLTDHPYQDCAPAEGWQSWAHGCFEKADIVLVVGSPKLKARYEKTEEPGTGLGATYEGAFVMQYLYNNGMRNNKVYPVLPDGGEVSHIPTALQSWWANHRFPTGYEGIGRMILNRRAGASGSESGAAPGEGSEREPTISDIRQAHEQLTAALLHDAPEFFEALRRELPRFLLLDRMPDTSIEMARLFAQCPRDQAQQLFFLVRRALLVLAERDHQPTSKKKMEEAATCLYFLAACRLVDNDAYLAIVAKNDLDQRVVLVPSDENVVCAIIATALFGRERRLTATPETDLPYSRHIFDVVVAAAGDDVESGFAHAAFDAVCSKKRDATYAGLYTDELDADQRMRFEAILDEIRNVELETPALVIRGIEAGETLAHAKAVQGLAKSLELPIMMRDDAAASNLLGMDVNRLKQELRLLREKLPSIYGHPPNSQPLPGFSPEGGHPMPPKPGSGVIFTGPITGPVTVTTGDKSPAQAGSGHSANIGDRQGVDLSALIPILLELNQEIGELSSHKAQQTLTAQVQVAQAEVKKNEKADPGVIKRALDATKSGAEVLENGGKIISLCNKGYNVLAPLFGLPQLPIP